MLNLINFFEEAPADDNQWVMYVIMGVILVGMVLMMIIPNRRQKKKAQEMMSKLSVGSTITTIGGIVGEVIELDAQNVWIRTGTEENPTTMKFIRQAIYSIANGEAQQQEKFADNKDEFDEIK